MATVSVVNTTKMTWYSGTPAVKIARCTGATLTITHEPRNINSKDSNAWDEYLEGNRSWEGSAEGLVAFDDTNGALSLTESILERTKFTLIFKTPTTGDTNWSGDVYVNSVEVSSSGNEENVTYNVSFTGTGPITEAVNA